MATLPCQLSWAANAHKEAYKAMLKLITYNAQGQQLGTANAFFVGNNTQVATSYSALKDAYKAEVVDFKGNKYPLHRILGANSTTDLVLFTNPMNFSIHRLPFSLRVGIYKPFFQGIHLFFRNHIIEFLTPPFSGGFSHKL